MNKVNIKKYLDEELQTSENFDLFNKFMDQFYNIVGPVALLHCFTLDPSILSGAIICAASQSGSAGLKHIARFGISHFLDNKKGNMAELVEIFKDMPEADKKTIKEKLNDNQKNKIKFAEKLREALEDEEGKKAKYYVNLIKMWSKNGIDEPFRTKYLKYIKGMSYSKLLILKTLHINYEYLLKIEEILTKSELMCQTDAYKEAGKKVNKNVTETVNHKSSSFQYALFRGEINELINQGFIDAELNTTFGENAQYDKCKISALGKDFGAFIFN